MGYCTACGRARSPLVATPVELAGGPSRIGGAVTRAIAWLILTAGLLFAVIVGAIFIGLTSTGALGWVIGGAIAFATLALGLPLLYGGRALQKMGAGARREALERAVFALAKQKGGTILASDLAQALRVPWEEADAFLTELAKRPDEPVRVDIDDEGRVLYRVPAAEPPARRYRVWGEGGLGEEPLVEEEAEAEDEFQRRL